MARSLSVAVLTVVVVAPGLWRWQAPAPVPPPRPLLIFYGSLPNQGQEAALASLEDQISGYSLVVVHSGLESPRNPSAAVLTTLVQARPKVAFYGYLALGVTNGEPDHSLTQIAADLVGWRQLGVRGVLLDTAGHDYGVSTARLAAAMDEAHHLGLRVIVNAYRPQDVLAAPWLPGDLYLAENWALAEGAAPGPRAEPTMRALYRLEMAGVTVAATATERSGWPFSSQMLGRAVSWTMDMVPGIRWLAVAGPNYSATSGAIVPAHQIGQMAAAVPRDY